MPLVSAILPGSTPAAGPVPAVPADKAQIAFLDPSNSIANAFPPAIHEISGPSGPARTFLTRLGSHVNAAVLVEPGHHVLMSRVLASAHAMEANVEAGHRYDVLVRFLYARGFPLRPMRTTEASASSEFSVLNPNFKERLSDAKWAADPLEYPAGTDPARFGAKLDEHQAGGQAECWMSRGLASIP